MIQGAAGGAGRLASSHSAWQATLHSLFEDYVATRSAAVADALPALEKAVAAAGGDVAGMLAATRRELAPRLAQVKAQEQEAMAALAQAVLASVRSPAAGPAAAAQAVAQALADEKTAAETAANEVASLRDQLTKLQAELAAARAGGGAGAAVARSSSAAEMGSPLDRMGASQRNSMARTATESERKEYRRGGGHAAARPMLLSLLTPSPSRAHPPSHPLVTHPHLTPPPPFTFTPPHSLTPPAGPLPPHAGSPMYARASSVSVDETPARGGKGIRGLPADNMGQVRLGGGNTAGGGRGAGAAAGRGCRTQWGGGGRACGPRTASRQQGAGEGAGVRGLGGWLRAPQPPAWLH